MKREIIAASILASLIVLSIINVNYIHNKANGIYETLDISENFSMHNEDEKALDYTQRAFDAWINLTNYAYIFMRQSEFDDVTSSFGELISELNSKDDSITPSYEIIRREIDSVISIEKISITSIF